MYKLVRVEFQGIPVGNLYDIVKGNSILGRCSYNGNTMEIQWRPTTLNSEKITRKEIEQLLESLDSTESTGTGE